MPRAGIKEMQTENSFQGYTLHRYENASRERHYLWCASCGCIFREEFGVHLVQDAKIISTNHKDCSLNYFRQTASRIFQNCFDIDKALSYLVFEIVTNDFPC